MDDARKLKLPYDGDDMVSNCTQNNSEAAARRGDARQTSRLCSTGHGGGLDGEAHHRSGAPTTGVSPVPGALGRGRPMAASGELQSQMQSGRILRTAQCGELTIAEEESKVV